MAHAEGQQHPLGVYIKVWALLFVLSTFSYLVDFYHVEGYLRWTLILIFMFLKAGFIIAVFMHIKWERMAMSFAILGPPLVLLVLIAMMVIESDYTFLTRTMSFGGG
jgi:cytochrome c oxidase subunit 4